MPLNRNSARAKTKDVAGRTQKGHFMKQKHQILVRGLRNNSLDDVEHRITTNGRIEDIAFAHARRGLQHDQNTLPTRNTSAQPQTPSRGLLSSSSPRSSRQRLLKRSKILEDLDIIEPTGLKATVERILRRPDLAGLNRLNNRPISPKYKRQIDIAGDDARGRVRADEVASSSSSSSYRYDSPTRRATSEYSIADNRPFSFPDRVSPLQDARSNSSYPDSGFSELQFSDTGEKEHERTHQNNAAVREVEVEDCYKDTSSNSSFFSNASLPPRARQRQASQMSLVDALPRHHIAGQLRQSELPKHQEISVFYISNANGQPSHPLAEPRDSRSSPSAATGHHQATGIGEPRRFGVGYTPSNLDTDYKPFVPLTTMLPSYSEEDIVWAEDGMSNTNDFVDMLMDSADTDDQMGDKLLITDGKSTALYHGHRIIGTSSSRSSPKSSDRPIFQTPARRFITSPTLRSSLEHRSRSTFPPQATVNSILALDNRNDVSDRFAFHTQNEIPRPSTFSMSPGWLIPENEDRAQNDTLTRRDEDSSPSVFTNSPSLRPPRKFDSKTTDDEGDRRVANVVQHLLADSSAAGGDEARSVAAFGSTMRLSSSPEAGGLLPVSDGTRSLWTSRLPSPSQAHCDVKVSVGPDLFAGDEDDEDE